MDGMTAGACCTAAQRAAD